MLRRDRADGLARVADETGAEVGTHQEPDVDLCLDLTVTEGVVPARGEDREQPAGGAVAPGRGLEIAKAEGGFGGDARIGRMPGKVEPAPGEGVAAEDIVGPRKFEHHIEIGGVGLVRGLQVLQCVLHVPGLEGALGHHLGVDGGGRPGVARRHDLLHMEDRAHAVGQLLVGAGEDAIEQRLRGEAFAAGDPKKTELGRTKEVVGGVLDEDAEFDFGFGLEVHAEEEVGELAPELVVGRIECEGGAEFRDEGVAVGEKFTGELGGPGFAAAGRGEEGGVGLTGTALQFPDTAQIHQHRATVGQQPPGPFIVLGGQGEEVALLRESGEFEVGREVVGAERDGAGPAIDTGCQGVVDVVECLLGGVAGGAFGAMTDTVEGAAGFGL